MHTPLPCAQHCSVLSHPCVAVLHRLGLGLPHIPPPSFGQQPHRQQQEQELAEVIRESKRVGELLLKAGDQELGAVQQQADQLLDKFK